MSDKEKFEGFTLKAVIGQASKFDNAITVEIGRTKMQEMTEANKGDIIVLDKMANDFVDIMVNGELAAKGVITVLKEENFAVIVREVINSLLYLDEVIELDRRKDELIDLFANEKLISKGTVVVVEEYFAVRLVEAV